MVSVRCAVFAGRWKRCVCDQGNPDSNLSGMGLLPEMADTTVSRTIPGRLRQHRGRPQSGAPIRIGTASSIALSLTFIPPVLKVRRGIPQPSEARNALEVEPHTRSNQVLSKVPTFARFELSACVIEIVVFDKSAEFRIPIVIRAGDDLPRKIGMACATACAEVAARAMKIESGGFRIVDADTSADVGLKSAKSESPNEIRHKCPGVNETGSGARSGRNAINVQSCIRASPEAVVKEITFDGWTKHAGAKNIPRFYSAEKADIILRINFKGVPEFIAKRSAAAAVLINVRSCIDRQIETGAKDFR